MKDHERVLRLHRQMDTCEAELADLAQKMNNLGESDALQALRHRHNLARAKLNALQTLFDSDYQQPVAKAAGRTDAHH